MTHDLKKYRWLGHWMVTALLFARTYRGWHSFDNTARSTREPIKRLAKRGLVEINEFNQFRAI